MAEGSLAFRECRFPRAIGPIEWLGSKRLSRFWRAYVATSSGESGMIRTTPDGACTLEWPGDAQVVRLSQSILIPRIDKGSPLTLHVKVEADRDVQWHRCIKSIQLCAARGADEGDVIAEFSQPLIGMNGENSVYYVQCLVDGLRSGGDAEIVLWFAPRAMQVCLRKVAVGFTGDSEAINLIHEKPAEREPTKSFAPGAAVARVKKVPDSSDRSTVMHVPHAEAGFRAFVDDAFATHVSHVKSLLETSISAIVSYYTSARRSEVDETFNHSITSLVRLNERNIANFSMENHALRTKVASLQRELDEYTGRR